MPKRNVALNYRKLVTILKLADFYHWAVSLVYLCRIDVKTMYYITSLNVIS